MENKMWKPGTAKPQSKKNKNKRKSPSRSNSNGNKLKASTPKKGGNDDDDDAVASNSTTAPDVDPAAPPKKLSGALMSMKFMKRNNRNNNNSAQHHRQNASSKQSAASPHASNKTPPQHKQKANDDDDDPMEVDTPEIDSKEVAHSPLVVQQRPPIAKDDDDDALVDMTPATSVDMYGISVIGRRSFGGFNRPVEDAWKASYRGKKEASKNNNKMDNKVSDEELLARYANIAKQRGNSNNNGGDASRQPVGNLAEKVKPLKKMSEEKRKRR